MSASTRLSEASQPLSSKPSQPLSSRSSQLSLRMSAPNTPASTAAHSGPAPADFMSLKPNFNLTVTAQQSYVAFCRIYLRQRLYRILSLSFVAAWACLSFSAFSPLTQGKGAFLNFVRPTILLASFPAFVALVPIIVLRKLYLTAIPCVRPSFLTRLVNSFGQPSTWIFCGMHAVGGAVWALIYAIVVTAVGENAELGVLRFHKARDTYYFNERLLFLVLCNTVLGFVYGLWKLVGEDRTRARFVGGDPELSPVSPLGTRVWSRVTGNVPRAAKATAIFAVVFFVSYAMGRRSLWRVVLRLGGRRRLRPIITPILRAYFVTPMLLYRTVVLAAASAASWEATHSIFDVYSTQAIMVSQFAKDRDRCLLDGMRATDPYFQHFAYLELSSISDDHERRIEIYKDIRSNPPAWRAISRECLKLIGQEYNTLMEVLRGPSPAPAATSAPAPAPLATVSSRSTAVATPRRSSPRSAVRPDKPLLVPPPKSVWDRLASNGDSATRRGIQKPQTAPVPTTQTKQSARQLSLYRVSDVAIKAARWMCAWLPKGLKEWSEVGGAGRVWTWLPEGWKAQLEATGVRRALFEIKKRDEVVKAVPRAELSIWATEALSNLTCASLNEDPYGSVQRDITKILEAFVIYYDALSVFVERLSTKAHQELASQKDESRKLRLKSEWDEAVGKELLPLQTALHTGISSILNTFSRFELKFPPRIARRLDSFFEKGRFPTPVPSPNSRDALSEWTK